MSPGHIFTDEDSMAGYTTGLCLARYARKLQPTIKILVYTSGSDAIVKSWFDGKTYARLIHRPDSARQILDEGMALIEGTRRLPRMFIVHGHDAEMVRSLQDYVRSNIGLGEPIILAQQASLGRTIIEQLEETAGRIDVAFVLLTPDDVATDTKEIRSQKRARQNVLFELGYFFALLRRSSGRVILLRKGEVELPSDLGGLRWVDVSYGIDKAAGDAIEGSWRHGSGTDMDRRPPPG